MRFRLGAFVAVKDLAFQAIVNSTVNERKKTMASAEGRRSCKGVCANGCARHVK